jgi:hypothetical protein
MRGPCFLFTPRANADFLTSCGELSRQMLLVGRRLKVAARRCIILPYHGACAYSLRGDGAVFDVIEMLAGASWRARAGATSSRSCSSSRDGGDAAPVHRRG